MGFTQKEYEILKANLKRKGAKPKCNARPKPVAKAKAQEENTGRAIVRIQSFRTRFLDPDNSGVKYLIDGLRYAGIITDDSTRHIILSVYQVKVKTRAEERTEVEIIK